MQYIWKGQRFKEIIVSGWVRNLLDEKYVSNAWVYRFQSSGASYGDIYEVAEEPGTDRYNLTGAFPQAGRNFFLGLTLKF